MSAVARSSLVMESREPGCYNRRCIKKRCRVRGTNKGINNSMITSYYRKKTYHLNNIAISAGTIYWLPPTFLALNIKAGRDTLLYLPTKRRENVISQFQKVMKYTHRLKRDWEVSADNVKKFIRTRSNWPIRIRVKSTQ